ncbi:hypothetical protein ACE10Z_34410 [Bradyrhizobium sp. Pha-3]|uniref:hypothetical protein n=1 Tax=Bradyrhizobium sp. Pha-3 TaxID=208375 RepID=UPI0035D517CB
MTDVIGAEVIGLGSAGMTNRNHSCGLGFVRHPKQVDPARARYPEAGCIPSKLSILPVFVKYPIVKIAGFRKAPFTNVV